VINDFENKNARTVKNNMYSNASKIIMHVMFIGSFLKNIWRWFQN